MSKGVNYLMARKRKAVKQPTPETSATDENGFTQYHLCFFQGRGDFIHRQGVEHIQNLLDAKVTTAPEKTRIDLWLDSPGGDAHAAYKLFLDLRSRCHNLRAVVPDMAKSAATLLLLGTDTVFMSRAAELGPLDVQLEHPDREGYTVSGLDVTDSLEFLARTAIDSVITGGAALHTYTSLPRAMVLHETLQFMAQLYQPMMAKLDPHLIHQAAQQLQVAVRYADIMLKNRNLEDGHELDHVEVGHLMLRLVNHYPAHAFVISRDEARKLGLPIEHAETYSRWSEVQTFHKIFANEQDSSYFVVEDSELNGLHSREEDAPNLEGPEVEDGASSEGAAQVGERQGDEASESGPQS